MATCESFPVNAPMMPVRVKRLIPIDITTDKFIVAAMKYAASSVVLACILLTFPSTGSAQTTCRVYCSDGTSVIADCNTNVDPCPSRSGGSRNPVNTPSDPRQIALQNAVPRYNALVHSLYDKYNLVDEKSWLNLPLGTEAEFFDIANQMHKFLVNQADANRFREGQLREKLADLNEVIETYPRLIANLRTDNETMRVERNHLTVVLQAAKRQLELTQRATKQLETRAYHYEEDAKRDKETVLSWFTVLLPPGMVKTVSPRPYESIGEPLVGSVMERQRVPEAVEQPKPVEPIALHPSHYGIRLEIKPKPLTGTAGDAIAQLEADADAFRAAIHDQSAVFDSVKYSEVKAAPLQLERSNALDERERLKGEVKTFGGQLKVTTRALLLAGDELQSAKETFLYRAADAWIWGQAKTEAISQVKDAVRRLVAAKSTGVLYRDMTDGEMRAFFSAGRWNIFGLGDIVLKRGDGLYQVLDRFQTLRTHALGNMEESFRVAAEGSPREMLEFADRMFAGMEDDSEQLVKANLGAINLPEPWQSVCAKYLLQKRE
jgi:hypothetical protein